MMSDPEVQQAISSLMTLLSKAQQDSETKAAARAELQVRSVQALESIALNLGKILERLPAKSVSA